MKKIKLGSGFTVFLLFFGISVIEAFESKNWFKVAFWVGIGVVFLLADNLRRA